MSSEFDPRKDSQLTQFERDSREDSQSTKFKPRPRIFVKLSFGELFDSKLSGLYAFDNMTIIH